MILCFSMYYNFVKVNKKNKVFDFGDCQVSMKIEHWDIETYGGETTVKITQ